jgi:protein phosphatase
MATRWLEVDLSDPEAVSGAVAWWEELTAVGGEGMVVKPSTFLAHGPKGLLQPAIKCRGKDYLRIIYGPDYDAPANLERLRQRNLGAKRSLAHREFSLGLEALHRFVDKRPLREIHPLVFAILALESTPVDPRL